MLNRMRWLQVFLLMMMGFNLNGWCQPAPRLDSLYPKGIQKGKQAPNGEPLQPVNRVTLYGQNLTDISDVMISGNGVEKVRLLEQHTADVSVSFSGSGVSGKIDQPHRALVEITLSPAAEMNTRRVRVVTPFGVSNPLDLIVGDLNEVMEDEPNSTLSQAQTVSLPLTLNGVISSNDDVDMFRFDAKQGQRIFCEIHANRIGSPLDSFLVLYDEEGHEITRNDIANGLDSLIDTVIKQDGSYTLSLRDMRYKGGGDYFYRLSIGELPYLDSIFPLGGKRGTENTLQIRGRNLNGINTVRFSIAHDAQSGIRTLRLTPSSGFATNPLPFAVSDLPEVIENEPNNSIRDAMNINVPVIVNGRMDEEDDIDFFSFEAKTGDRLIFEALSKRLGTNLDGFLELFDPEGNSIAVNDDAVGVEARLDQRFDQDGRYTIAIRDLSNRGGSRFAYRLQIEPLQKGLLVSVSPDNPSITAGGSVPLSFSAARTGFRNAVRIELNGLPDGITTAPAVFSAEQNTLLVSLNADDSTQPGLYRLSATAITEIDPSIRTYPVSPETIYLTVIPHPRYTLDIVEIAAAVDQMKSSRIRVRANRINGFASPIRLNPVGLPAGVNANNPTIPESQTEAVINFSAQPNAQTGTVWISAVGESSEHNERIVQYAPAIPFTVNQAPFTVDVEPKRLILPLSAPATHPGATTTEEVEITVSINRNGYFSDEIKVIPQNSPDQMLISVENALPGMNEVKIKLAADLQMKADTHTLFFLCRAEVNGQTYEQRTPGVSVKLIDSGSIEE